MIVVLDMGSTRNTDVARAIRSLGVYSEICNFDVTADELNAMPNVRGVVANGGPNDVVDGKKIALSEEVKKSGLPVYTFDYAENGRMNKMPESDQEIAEALRSFVFDTCKAAANWNMENFIADQVELMRRRIGDKKVLLALSGGVGFVGRRGAPFKGGGRTVDLRARQPRAFEKGRTRTGRQGVQGRDESQSRLRGCYRPLFK